MNEDFHTIVIGAGQAGLSVGYHLAKRHRPFVILDANERVGDSWRQRWDSLRLFTPAMFCGLAGMPFPAPRYSFPTKDEMADYLEAYAEQFELPVRTGTRVDRLTRNGNRFVVTAGDQTLKADNVVVAMANYQHPKVPAFADRLDPRIVALHSMEYRNPGQLRDGPVLLVGAGNSGAEIALELAAHHETWIAGRDVGAIPFRIDGVIGRHLARVVLRTVFHRVLTIRTPMGRRLRAKVLGHGGPLIRTKLPHLGAAGVRRAPRVRDVEDGLPVLQDGTVLDVANVIWCTGFEPGFDWIDLPVMGQHEPRHDGGIVPDVPGLYFVGLHFLTALSSAMIHGVDRDAERIVGAISVRAAEDPAAYATSAETVADWMPTRPAG